MVAGSSPTMLLECNSKEECQKELRKLVDRGATIEFLKVIKGEELAVEKKTEQVTFTKHLGYTIL